MKEEWEGQQEGGEWEEATGRGRRGGGQQGGGDGEGSNVEGHMGQGATGRKVKEMGLAHGMPGWNEITVLLTLLTRATPHIPASILLYVLTLLIDDGCDL